MIGKEAVQLIWRQTFINSRFMLSYTSLHRRMDFNCHKFYSQTVGEIPRETEDNNCLALNILVNSF